MKTLTRAQQKFITHWGSMGTQWGINRTVAQIHALLFVSPQPLPAEDIAEALGVARSNVSNSIRELQNWGIIRSAPVMGDRREHFETIADVWELFRIVLEKRKRKEFDPTLELLRECLAEANQNPADTYTRGRLAELLGFFETMGAWFDQIRKLPNSVLITFVKSGEKLVSLLRGS